MMTWTKRSAVEHELLELREQYRGRLTLRQWFGIQLARLGFMLCRLARWFIAGREN